LDNREAAGGAHLAQSQRTVGAAAGKNHADRSLALIFRQRAKEKIDRHADAVALLRFGEIDTAFFDPEKLIGRDRVDMIGCDRHAVGRLPDLHLGMLAEDVGHVARVIGIEVLDDDESHARLGWHGVEEFFQGF
jgi:hypothetical protein